MFLNKCLVIISILTLLVVCGNKKMLDKLDNSLVMVIVVFIGLFIYLDNYNNLENFEGAPVDFGSDSSNDTPKGNAIIEEPIKIQPEKPIGQVPQKVVMKAPPSMVGSLESLTGAPIGDNFMLLPKDVVSSTNTVDSAVPMAYPRMGGYGNLGKDSPKIAESKDPSTVPGPVGTDSTVKSSGGKNAKVVIIYAPWCGWSKKSLPEFKKMEQKLNNIPSTDSNGYNISCELYNSEDPVGKQKVKEYKPRGFPAVYVEVDNKRQEGPREYSKMVQLLNNLTGSSIK